MFLTLRQQMHALVLMGLILFETGMAFKINQNQDYPPVFQLLLEPVWRPTAFENQYFYRWGAGGGNLSFGPAHRRPLRFFPRSYQQAFTPVQSLGGTPGRLMFYSFVEGYCERPTSSSSTSTSRLIDRDVSIMMENAH